MEGLHICRFSAAQHACRLLFNESKARDTHRTAEMSFIRYLFEKKTHGCAADQRLNTHVYASFFRK